MWEHPAGVTPGGRALGKATSTRRGQRTSLLITVIFSIPSNSTALSTARRTQEYQLIG